MDSKKEQQERYMKMSFEERKQVAKAVKGGTAYKTWKKANDRIRMRYLFITIGFFIVLGLEHYANVSTKNKDFQYLMTGLLLFYVAFIVIVFAITTIYYKRKPLVWTCPQCHKTLPMRHTNYSKNNESVTPDVYVDHCPYCGEDLTK